MTLVGSIEILWIGTVSFRRFMGRLAKTQDALPGRLGVWYREDTHPCLLEPFTRRPVFRLPRIMDPLHGTSHLFFFKSYCNAVSFRRSAVPRGFPGRARAHRVRHVSFRQEHAKRLPCPVYSLNVGSFGLAGKSSLTCNS